jgi:hypothetical protein
LPHGWCELQVSIGHRVKPGGDESLVRRENGSELHPPPLRGEDERKAQREKEKDIVFS